ncbi:efflux RND transporter periplasmic adaptor subunit [Rhizobium sp. SSM4.3]|uniref:Efflux RND transporter periplasmic adaptor subunit n=2 Tax=Peteryoungia algae TaxID=2919917 RepID=A0ABT0D1E8_9HYPH|nr:efflux RND transporter periplasmic adaptor subunit [Rhizobium sp. SSM4.3]MCJ8239099.1 efflux RND transporter periplasmic adaptor subunit [Rhizobium sp. SSM4.3]
MTPIDPDQGRGAGSGPGCGPMHFCDGVAVKDDVKSETSPETEELKVILANAARPKARWGLRMLGLLVLAGLGYGAYLWSAGGTTVSYTTAELKPGDLTVLVTATGSVEPTVQVDVSSEQSGTVRDVLVDFNSEVKKGDVLARLDTDKLSADLKAKEAALASARASVSKALADEQSAKAKLDRQTTLVSSRVSTQQDLDTAEYTFQAASAARQSAEADVISAEAALEQAKLSVSKATIVSPIDGIVLSRDVDTGATVAASLEAPTLFTLAGDLRQMELQVSIDEADVGQVAVGQTATFTVDAFPEQRFPAEITSIRYAAETVSDVVTYKGILSVANDDLLLRQGMTATADIVVQSVENGLLIPNAALRYSPPATATAETTGGGSGVFSLFRPPREAARSAPEPEGSERTIWLLRDGEPVAVNIEIGASDGQNTVIVKGDVKQGDRVITDQTVRNG